ncbi:hypothetical protein IV38_GL002110 [Lactobacillus selangorensis]|uniref:Endonuclease MutS2 n=1 Tax=Lactobacillus selangorensis TaxID=81857 RepID=A0A0R2FFR6_9LACO|nr:endonuclease MutS2 [Lactobacillus selangorensis]KRN27458.1 hypothetical protein IV38_GL002110 [Lactobacillus selangorensis]KRN31345.1 hypothetical protein IV40_GL001340 [Lactobacillus selangorensis]
MNQKVLTTLEYDKIKQAVEKYTVTAFGDEQVRDLKPGSDAAQIQNELDETKDGADILRLKGGIPLPKLDNIRTQLKRLDIGAQLNGKELAQLGKILRTTDAVVDFIDELEENEIELRMTYKLRDQLVTLPAITRKIHTSIEDDGSVTDEASSQLKYLRRGIQQLEGQIRGKMESYTRGNEAKYLSDPIITIRNDRYVIPVRAEYRGHFGGVVHDQSATGQTLFIEPQSVMELNNKLREQELAEQREVQRVLAALSAEVAPYRQDIWKNAQILGQFDFMNAKAKYAKEIKATEPLLNPENNINLHQARHPLIPMDRVVANDIYLGKDFQAIVVTGPNTGGKTITLKTLGLVQLMAQSGLFIPAAEESQVGIFSDVFADIGDEQSIEQNLSTFSAHMDNTIRILHAMDANSLVLLDEVGAGTDPQEGAALAISILDQIGMVGAYVVATTHYPELKVYGYNTPGTVNASMEFDVETLQPTYKLLIGVPGRSNAFDISLKLGLDQSIVDRAKQLIATDTQDLNDMIGDLEKQRKQSADEYTDLQKQLAEATTLHQQLASAYQDFQKERDAQLEQAREKANRKVEKAQKKADKIVADLRDMQKNQQGNVKENKLIDAQTQLKNLHQEQPLPQNRVLRREKAKQALHAGDDVRVIPYGQNGVLLEQVDKNHWQVQLGILKMKVATKDLEKIALQPEKQATQNVATVIGGANNHVSTTLDLRGERYEQAMGDLDQYIDAALLANLHEVTIIHGMGTGAIRKGVQEYLKKNREVAKYAYAPANAGGTGATIVTFK